MKAVSDRAPAALNGLSLRARHAKMLRKLYIGYKYQNMNMNIYSMEIYSRSQLLMASVNAFQVASLALFPVNCIIYEHEVKCEAQNIRPMIHLSHAHTTMHPHTPTFRSQKAAGHQILNGYYFNQPHRD